MIFLMPDKCSHVLENNCPSLLQLNSNHIDHVFTVATRVVSLKQTLDIGDEKFPLKTEIIDQSEVSLSSLISLLGCFCVV